MILLCWNCRGLGRDSAVGELRWLVKQYRPSLLFLSETKMRDDSVRKFMWSLGFSGCFPVNSEGRSGGLVLFWTDFNKISLKNYCKNFIDVTITQEDGLTWRATFVYGEPKSELRHVFWDRIRFLRAQWKGPWICAGDFNEVLNGHEHKGRCDRRSTQMNLFRECLEDCELIDLGYIGPKFTWNNRQAGINNVRVRLDRAVANGHFIQLFDEYQVENVVTSSSDHYAIKIELGVHGQGSRSIHAVEHFRYEDAWSRAPDYKDAVEQFWKEGYNGPINLQSTWNNLQRMACSLKQWSRDSFGSVRKEIKKLQSRLSRLSSSTTIDFSQERKNIEQRLCELFEREEIMARQRSSADWLLAGDRNTNFFHARASACRRNNKIRYLVQEDGTKCEDQEAIKRMATDFYSNLFSSEPNANIEAILDAIPTKVDQNINEELCKPCTDEEIEKALFQMGPTKAPGPDGFSALFYQRHWDFFKEDICSAVRSFLQAQLRYIWESEELRRAMEPVDLIRRVKEIEQEAYGEHGMATDEDPKQTAAVDLSKRLKDLRAGNDGSSQKALEEWRKRKMERARQRAIERNGTSSVKTK